MKTIVSAKGAPKAIGPYSQAVAAGGFLFVSGQIALDPDSGQLTGESAAEQARRCLESLGAILAEKGVDFQDVVRTTLYLQDLADFDSVNAEYAKVFASEPPARATFQVAKLPKGARVEIDAIAVLSATK